MKEYEAESEPGQGEADMALRAQENFGIAWQSSFAGHQRPSWARTDASGEGSDHMEPGMACMQAIAWRHFDIVDADACEDSTGLGREGCSWQSDASVGDIDGRSGAAHASRDHHRRRRRRGMDLWAYRRSK